MKDGPSIAGIAALLGDRARSDILTALMTDQALTATELAAEAGVTKQTASAHLAKLLDARLIAVESQGRHRYFRLADRDVAQLMESLMGVAFRAGAVRLRSSPREPALRKARMCYDHLAGDLGVQLYDALLDSRAIAEGKNGLAPSTRGRRVFHEFGIDLETISGRRPLCRACLDWSARRHHLAGALGAALLARFVALGWARIVKGTRVIAFTPSGENALRQRFGLVEAA
jgi:DNA-binding transcriptional ArsR family regulator